MEQKKKSGALLKTALILSVLIIQGCGCLPNAPDVRPKQINQRLGTCDQYTIKFKEKLILTFEKELPLEECLIDGHFILTDSELLELRRIYVEARKCYQDTRRRRCK